MILVTGATGNVGRNVVQQLLEAGETVRALTRNPEKAGLPGEVEVHAGDIADPSRLHTALKDVDRVFLFPVFGQLEGFLKVAMESRVDHIAMLSSSAIEFEDPGFIGQIHLECENAVKASALPHTFVRAGLFMLNDRGWAPQIRESGTVRAAYGTAATAPVDERDIAAVAVASLLSPSDGSVHSLTGPESLSQIDRVRIIGDVLGRPVEFEELSREAALGHLVRQMPPEAAGFLLDQLASWQGVTAEVLPTVEQVTGRPAHTYAQWVEHHRADFS